MNRANDDATPPRDAAPEASAHADIAELVGQLYEAAPASERSRLLEQLLQPLGVLSLVAVANGVFAKIAFHSRWQELRVPLEDTQGVRASHVITLVDYVQQVSAQAVDGLAQVVSMSPVMASSGAAALLLALLLKRSKPHAADSGEAAEI